MIQDKNKQNAMNLFNQKNENPRGFRVFDFSLHPKSKTRKSQKVLFYFNFW